MLDSLVLSIFFFGFLLLQVWLYGRFDFSFLEQGRTISLRGLRWAGLVLVGVAALALVLTFLVMYTDEPQTLQRFYTFLFTASLVLTGLFLLPGGFYRRLIASLVVTFSLLAIVLAYPIPLLQNLFMAGSFLWIGPVVFRRFKLPTKHFIIFLLIFAAVDAYNIYFAKTLPVFSDENFLFNALVQFGEFSLGLGDFFLAYLIVSHAKRDYGTRTAIWLTALFPAPRFLIRIVFPGLAGATFPYGLFLVPITLVVYLIVWLREPREPHAANPSV